MRALYPLAAALLLFVSGCSATTSPQPTATPTPTATSAPTPTPSGTAELPTTDPGSGSGQGAGAPDDSGRFSYLCTSLDGVPDVTLSSLAEVWASTGYLRLASCQARYEGPDPYEATDDEARIIAIAEPGVNPSDGLDAYLAALGLCTRVSDDAASELFGQSPRTLLQAASELCPRGPQGKIIALWASGARAADGQYAVSADGLTPGRFHLRKAPPEGCTWSVAGADGKVKSTGGAAEGQSGITLAEKDVLTSDKCGIWEKIE